jgi:hypothetical protein
MDFDISFPTLSCNLLSMDAIDDRGIPQVDAVHDLFKHKLDFSGQKVHHCSFLPMSFDLTYSYLALSGGLSSTTRVRQYYPIRG